MKKKMLLFVIIYLCYYAVFEVQLSMSIAIEINYKYPDERAALLQLRDSFNYSSTGSNLHSNWTGPPCYQNQSRWAGIVCFDWHVTHLVLEGINLTGSLPPSPFLHNLTFLSKLSFQNNSISGPLPDLTPLANLEFVFLSQNSFSGSIPSHYIHLPKLANLELQQNSLDGSIPAFDQPTLELFNVSYNRLKGPIPPTPILQRFSKISYVHNSELCGQPLDISCPPTSPPPTRNPPSKDKNKVTLEIWSIALIVAAVTLVPFFVMLVFLCYYRRARGKEEKGKGFVAGRGEKKRKYWPESMEDPERMVALEFFDKERPVFDLDELLRASAEVMGKGKLGTTYKAMVESGPCVAVKRLRSEMSALSKNEFVQQMQLLGNLRHENLVEIISFYYSKQEKLVVYEFVPNGNLFELLHENRGVGSREPLNWTARLSIIREIAKGLTFLHHFLPFKVPHGNLKSSNILIQRNGRNNHSIKLTDFGFLSLLQQQSRKSCEMLAIGKSPEFSQGKKLTYKSDIYCFGIIILEVITGKIPGEISRGGEEGTTSLDGDDLSLSDWVRAVVNSDWSTDILDVEILSAKDGHDEMLRLTEIALECTDVIPEKRPKMSQVLAWIEEMELVNKGSAAW